MHPDGHSLFPTEITRLVERACDFAKELGDRELTSYHLVRTALVVCPSAALESLRGMGYALPALRCYRAPPREARPTHTTSMDGVEIGAPLRSALGRLVTHGPQDLGTFLRTALSCACPRLRCYLAALGCLRPDGPCARGFSGLGEYLESAKLASQLRRGAVQARGVSESVFVSALQELERHLELHEQRAQLASTPLPLELSQGQHGELSRAVLDELLVACLVDEGSGRGRTVPVDALMRRILLDRSPRLDFQVLQVLIELGEEGRLDSFDHASRCDTARLGGRVRLSIVAEREVLEALEKDPIQEADREVMRRRMGG